MNTVSATAPAQPASARHTGARRAVRRSRTRAGCQAAQRRMAPLLLHLQHCRSEAALGPLVVERLASILDLSFVLLLSPPRHHQHRRVPLPAPALEQAREEGMALLADPPRREPILTRRIAALPVLFLIISTAIPAPAAILCLGPRRSGGALTHAEREVAATIAQSVGAVLEREALRTRHEAHGAQIAELAAECARLRARMAEADRERQLLADALRAGTDGTAGAPSQPESAAPAQTAVTPQERLVLAHLADGLSNKEIARNLRVTLRTVEQHLTHLYRKLQVTSRTQAVAAARARGLLPAERR